MYKNLVYIIFSEYYFSLFNLKRDAYMLSKLDEEGYFPLILVSGLERVAQYTNDLCVIADVIRSSKFVELCPNGLKVF